MDSGSVVDLDPADVGGIEDAGTVVDAGSPPPPPAITRFLATPSQIERGQGVVLEWEVAAATEVRIEPDLGVATGSSLSVWPSVTTTYFSVWPSVTTTYRLTARGEGGSTTATVTVVVTEPPPPAWASMSWGNELPDGYNSDVYRWLDSKGEQRTAVLTRNDARDPGGTHGGMLRRFRYGSGAKARVATGTGASSGAVKYNGWGYVVSHYGSGNSLVARSADVTGQYRQVLMGRHHAIHEFSWDLLFKDGTTQDPKWVPVKTTVQWFFATGRDHPVYAITFDSSAALPQGLSTQPDSRTPYGDIAWDGDGTLATVDGVKWGDKYQFYTRDEPLTPASRWDYKTRNEVPYASAYSRTADAEMGIVQTLSWVQHNTGGSWLNNNWGKDSETQIDSDTADKWVMPANWNWPYQLCQFEMNLDQTTTSKRVAWGLMSGSVGRASYWGYGYEQQWSSLPYHSYSVFMVLGRPSEGTVQAQLTEVERALKAQPFASRGQVVAYGPGGVARSDSGKYAVPGYNGTYGVHEFKADTEGGFSVSLNAAGGALHNPIFLIRDMNAPLSRLTLDGVVLRADVDYFASYDDATKQVWITLNREWSGGHTLSNLPSGP
ncbi:hypothetical protein BON30_16135 [Cystobacter ferrugineus]|uniref:Uncharacterized protein n=2 Tax=Cystobacter ferrugineus TaxID=83449 RepID=A0A1L9B9Z7_9BACT|nr:hypothetical protein BON30_16135 [Cystobacter ferrugineus]